MRRFVHALTAIVLFSAGSTCGAEEAEPSFYSYFASNFPREVLSTSQGAINAATSIEKQCARILALVPRLSPAEDEWLQREIDAGRDLPNLMRRREWLLRVLYVHFSDCSTFSGIAARSSTEKERVIAWTALVSIFYRNMALYDYPALAGVNVLVKPVANFDLWKFLLSHKLIDNILIPYLIRTKSDN